GGELEIGEMRIAEGDQTEAVERSGDAQPAVAGGETEAPSIPVGGEPDEQDPRGRRHHHGLTAAPGSLHEGRQEEGAHSPQEEPEDESREQDAGRESGGAPEEQAETACQRE